MHSRIALLFPPQWDPRQPPRTIPSLTGALKKCGHHIKAWDMNLHLYTKLLRSPFHTNNEFSHYLNPTILKDIEVFGKSSSTLEAIINNKFDPTGQENLFWDDFYSSYSYDHSNDWLQALANPEYLSFFKWIEDIITEVEDFQPNIIGISSISDTQVIPSLAIASALRRKLPDAIIVFGGPGFSNRKSILERVPKIFQIANAVCIFDGAPALLSLAAGAPCNKAPNLITYDGIRVLQPHYFENTAPEDIPDFSIIPVNDYLSPRIVIANCNRTWMSLGEVCFLQSPSKRFTFDTKLSSAPLRYR